jgi:translation initiation factor IF-2
MEQRIGEVTHYFGHIGVAVLVLTGELNVGDIIRFKGANTDFSQAVDSLEIEHQKVTTVGAGAEVALKVNQRVRQGDRVFKVSE